MCSCQRKRSNLGKLIAVVIFTVRYAVAVLLPFLRSENVHRDSHAILMYTKVFFLFVFFFQTKKKIIKSIVSIKYSCSCLFFIKLFVYNVHNLWKVYLRQQPDSMRSIYCTPLIVILPIIEISVGYHCMPRRLFFLFFFFFC